MYNLNLYAGCSEKVQRSSHLHCLHQVFFSNQHTRSTYDHYCIMHDSKCTYASKCDRYYLRELPDPLFCSAFARSNQLLYLYLRSHNIMGASYLESFYFCAAADVFLCVKSFYLHAHILQIFTAGSGPQQMPSRTIVVG